MTIRSVSIAQHKLNRSRWMAYFKDKIDQFLHSLSTILLILDCPRLRDIIVIVPFKHRFCATVSITPRSSTRQRWNKSSLPERKGNVHTVEIIMRRFLYLFLIIVIPIRSLWRWLCYGLALYPLSLLGGCFPSGGSGTGDN